MDQSQLRQTLEQLHGELENAQSVDEETRQLLQHLMAEIQSLLKESNPTPQQYESLGGRLDTVMGQVESSHPGLTLTIKQLIDHLAQV